MPSTLRSARPRLPARRRRRRRGGARPRAPRRAAPPARRRRGRSRARVRAARPPRDPRPAPDDSSRAPRFRDSPAPRGARSAPPPRANARTSACSRPPEPTTSTFTTRSYVSGPLDIGLPAWTCRRIPPLRSTSSACPPAAPSATASRSRSRSRSGSRGDRSRSRCGRRGTTRSSRSASASRKGCGRLPRACPDDLAANTVDVDAPGFDPTRLQRSFYTSSSCGVCGKGALEAVAVEAARVESELRVPLSLVAALPELLRGAQAGVRRDRRAARDGALLP